MPQTMTSPSMPLDTAALFRAARSKRNLALGMGLLALALGVAWYATTPLQPAPAKTPEAIAQPHAGLDRAALAKLDLSSFQRRGTLLVGEVTTPAGVRLRLVVDANTRALIGLRVVETEAGTAP